MTSWNEMLKSRRRTDQIKTSGQRVMLIMQTWGQSSYVIKEPTDLCTKKIGIHFCNSETDTSCFATDMTVKLSVRTLVSMCVLSVVELAGFHVQILKQTLPGTVCYVCSDTLTAPLLHNGGSQAAEIFKPRLPSPVCLQHIYESEQLLLQHIIWYLIQKWKQESQYHNVDGRNCNCKGD